MAKAPKSAAREQARFLGLLDKLEYTFRIKVAREKNRYIKAVAASAEKGSTTFGILAQPQKEKGRTGDDKKHLHN